MWSSKFSHSVEDDDEEEEEEEEDREGEGDVEDVDEEDEEEEDGVVLVEGVLGADKLPMFISHV